MPKLRSGVCLASTTSCHQRGVNQAVRIAFALRCRRQDTFSQLSAIRCRAFLRSKAGPCIQKCFSHEGNGIEIEIYGLLCVHQSLPIFLSG
jgi:hypothetical protein